MLVAHAYNSSYSEGRDQEDHGSKPAQANSSRDPISKNTITRKLVEWLKVGPIFKLQDYRGEKNACEDTGRRQPCKETDTLNLDFQV
jgi:hypothetical protein